MTRVNLVPADQLADQHLFAEWRELKMIPRLVRKNLQRGTPMVDLPAKYTMNAGHVRFFYDKMLWLFNRYHFLEDELHFRDYKLSAFDASKAFLNDMPPHLLKTWAPSPEEVKINVERIVTRLKERPTWYRYYGKPKSPDFFERFYETKNQNS
jgi:deoxyribonuclease (pyrimidine dimer)